MADPIRIATRKSPLALWQAEHVADRLRAMAPERPIELLTMTTAGDRWLKTPLSQVGGKGLFIKELETALYDGRADLAVHSMKDVTAHLPEGLEISTVLEREDPYDAFVSNNFASLDELPHGARLGTSSLRRQAQIKAIRPDLAISSVRGNVNTRLAKLDADEFDAILLACAGLRRLEFAHRIRQALDPRTCLPAVGQGIIGIEIRSSDAPLRALLDGLHHTRTAIRLAAERRFNATLDGGCSAPIAGFATLDDNTLSFTGRVLAIDGSSTLEHTRQGPATLEAAAALGQEVAEALLERGAQALLDEAARVVQAAMQEADADPDIAADPTRPSAAG